MNMLAQPASSDALAGVQGRIVDSLVDMFFASVSAAPCRFAASSVPIAVGWRNGNALLVRSSDSPGTSSTFSVVSPRRSRTVARSSREVSRRAGITPAEFARIRDCIQPDGIHAGGEVIALIPENAARAAEAVARLQAEAAAAEADEPSHNAPAMLKELEKQGRQMCAGFHKAARSVVDRDERQWVVASIQRVREMFNRLSLEID